MLRSSVGLSRGAEKHAEILQQKGLGFFILHCSGFNDLKFELCTEDLVKEKPYIA